MVAFGPLTAKIGWWVWGTPANFNGFRNLASLLHWCLSTEVNQTLQCLAILWPGTLHTRFGGSYPLTEFCQVQNSLCVQVLCFPILAVLLHGTRAVDVSQTLWHGTTWPFPLLGVMFLTFLGGRQGAGHMAKRHPATIAHVRWPVIDFT